MQLSPQDEKDLQYIAYEIDGVAQKLRAFRQRHGNLRDILVTPEYMTLHTMFNRLKKELDSIP